jgi:hypothetical protein
MNESKVTKQVAICSQQGDDEDRKAPGGFAKVSLSTANARSAFAQVRTGRDPTSPPTTVAHTISYSNPQELQVRITRLAQAAGWAS